jgi:hypothetical protein
VSQRIERRENVSSEPRIWRRAVRQGNGLDEFVDGEEDAGRIGRSAARDLRRRIDPLNDLLSVMADRLDRIAYAMEAPAGKRVEVMTFPGSNDRPLDAA